MLPAIFEGCLDYLGLELDRFSLGISSFLNSLITDGPGVMINMVYASSILHYLFYHLAGCLADIR